MNIVARIKTRNFRAALLVGAILAVGLLLYIRNVIQQPLVLRRSGLIPSNGGIGSSSLGSGTRRQGKVPAVDWELKNHGEAKPDLTPTNTNSEPLKLSVIPSSPTVTAGSLLQVTCVVTSGAVLQVTFHPPPSLSPELESQIQVFKHGGVAIMLFENVLKGHEGEYTCEATGSEGKVQYESVFVAVLEKEDMSVQIVSPTTESPLSTEHTEQSSASTVHPETELPSFSSIEERSQFQRDQVEQFCQAYGLADVKYKVPERGRGLSPFQRHMLLDDDSKTVFCFAPKVGCTNLKVLIFVTQGFIPRSELLKRRDDVDQNLLEAIMSQQSFQNRNVTQRENALKHYFKFIMYRNPLERLASGYRSKVQRFPLQGLNDWEPHYNWLRKRIYAYKHLPEYQAWMRGLGRRPVNISFPDFVDFWLLGTEEMRMDEHFRSIMEICFPCHVRYDFYGNFKNFDSDARVLMERIHAQPQYLRTGYYSETTKTESIVSEYYDQLSVTQRKNVFAKLAVELDFYYHMFPEEKNMHKSILKISDDIPLPRPIQENAIGAHVRIHGDERRLYEHVRV